MTPITCTSPYGKLEGAFKGALTTRSGTLSPSGALNPKPQAQAQAQP